MHFELIVKPNESCVGCLVALWVICLHITNRYIFFRTDEIIQMYNEGGVSFVVL